MRVSVELFLLDNLLMDYLILRLAAVFASVRLRALPALCAAAAGAVYALLATAYVPTLNTLVPKLLLGLVMALPLGRGRSRRAYLRGLACLYLAAFLSGGWPLRSPCFLAARIAAACSTERFRSASCCWRRRARPGCRGLCAGCLRFIKAGRALCRCASCARIGKCSLLRSLTAGICLPSR